ncbi:acyl-CoA N-acyltransferase [Teratosphaeria nubilosa]|uniref:Acyl-CoA N-acyltransferase n=1 Tax=Teratosphaeria nubilosa TaxID=161662 RepID=A0A6G1KTB6_9PEZI|nr:acyl-CoA N-acyltransferase [Teratosphaeria nubilosa]
MPIQVLPLTDPDIPGAITCIQRAFQNDPYNNWVFNQEAFSIKRNSVSLSLRCHWGMHHALFHIAKDPSNPTNKILGVACWLPPTNPRAPQTWHAWAGDWWLYLNQIWMNLWYGRGGLNVKRYYIWKSRQAEAQRELWDDENGYYFCNIVTVLPDAQGKGIGRILFQHVTDQADREGRKCYLESSRAEPNMAIYERLGFSLVREMVCDDDGEAITLYCMMREPRGTGDG